ncbi:ABC transporter substrate-binding protein [Nonomuraea longicatena]|uniref:ABC transporter substrate-binding protein n=1 Tax=Nonomuraea longicatena TaxID=83682 RepID=A0ABP4BMI4_9ACTN
MRRPATVLGAVLGTALTAAPGAAAIDPTKGTPGFCQDGTGVTVVVDFQELGGTTIVRCNPQAQRGTGLDALKGAGFQIAGVQRWGEAFICRIENRPSAVEQLPVKGKEGYREACIDTPPAGGYWSYWHAGNNCAWKYSQWGVKNRDFVAGGFEGWSFSLNATADTNPKPRIAAVRPGTEGGSCDAAEEPPPTSDDPNAVQPGSGDEETRREPPQPTQDAPAAQDPPPPSPRSDPDPPATQAPPRADPTPRAEPERPAVQEPTRRPKPESPAVRDAPSTEPEPPRAAPSGRPPPEKGDTLPRPLPRAARTSVPDDPARNVAFVGGEDSPDVSALVKEQSGASDHAPWVAAGAAVVLGAATWLTALRRRRARDG